MVSLLSRSKVDGAEGMAYFVKLVRRRSASRFRSNSRDSAAVFWSCKRTKK